MNTQNENQVSISDLGLASLLITLNFNMVGLERANEKRINFLFAEANGIEEAINSYWAGAEICVPVQSLFQNQRQLKNRLYAFK